MVVDLIDEDEPYFFTAAVCFNPAACSGKKVQIAYCAADASGEQVRVCDVDVGTSTVTQLYRLGPAESLGTWDRLTNTTGAHSFKAHPKSFSLMVSSFLCWNSLGSLNEGGVTILDTDPESGAKGTIVPLVHKQSSPHLTSSDTADERWLAFSGGVDCSLQCFMISANPWSRGLGWAGLPVQMGDTRMRIHWASSSGCTLR